MVTKSGSNAFHGNLYEFLRNDKLDARNSFASLRAPLRYNQYGGVIGGPIRKDRTFFFFNYEEWRVALGSTILDIVPTANERSGNFSLLRTATGAPIPVYDPATARPNPSGSGYINDPFPGNIIPAGRLDPVSQNILAFYPLPDKAPTNAFTNANNYIENIINNRRARQETIKFDHRLTEKDTLSGRYLLWDHKDDNAQGYWTNMVAGHRNDDYTNRNANVDEYPFVLPDFHQRIACRFHEGCIPRHRRVRWGRLASETWLTPKRAEPGLSYGNYSGLSDLSYVCQ